MKKLVFVFPILFLFLFSCNESSQDDEASLKEISLSRTMSGTIHVEGEIDWYHYRVNEADSMLQVRCTSNTYRPDVDLLVTVYELDSQGKKVRLFADHAIEDSQTPADITMNIFIDTPKDIYISVRDLLDDDSSDNKYYLTINFTGSEEGNDSFADALSITVDDAATCQSDSIGYIGDVDCFKFNAASAGVYDVNVEFTPFQDGTDVQLSIDLYTSEGTLVQSLSTAQSYDYHLFPYLASGEYYVLVDDYGKDDYDTSSTYQICVNSVGSNETNENDSMENATGIGSLSYGQSQTINGSIDYWGDEDWYRVSLPTGNNVLKISFDEGEEVSLNFQVSVSDSDGDVLLSHEHHGGSSVYETQLRTLGGDHYLVIQASQGQTMSGQAPYTASMEVEAIDDPAELVEKVDTFTGEDAVGNDTIGTAIVLLPDSDPESGTSGKVAFRGDIDWYSIEVDTTTPKILEVFLTTTSESQVEYYISIMRDSVVKTIYDSDGEDGPTELKASIPISGSGGSITYYFMVSDYQGDDGDDAAYVIRANINEIPGSVPAGTYSGTYNSEVPELDDTITDGYTSIQLDYNSLTHNNYKVNTTLLDFTDEENTDITRTENEGLTTISFPWITGYIDYQGDQDWLRIPIGPLNEDDTDWYYDIIIELHTDDPGSSVEYVWKFYPDRNQNNIVADRSSDYDGYVANAGDLSTDTQSIDVTIPTEGTDQEFWIGDGWEGNTYLSISDFNYLLTESGESVTRPDEDWGYDIPYYVRLTLIYHPGQSYPGDGEE